MTALRVRPAADADTDAAAEYYAREASLDVALRFLTALREAYERLVEHPGIGPEVQGFDARVAGLRYWPIPGFERF